MRENRPYGSEGGEEQSFPTPITLGFAIQFDRTALSCSASAETEFSQSMHHAGINEVASQS